MGVLDSSLLDTDNTTDDLSQLDEKSVILRAKTDKQAFGELYRRYVDRIYNYIYYRTGNKDDAEDLTAKTFGRAMKHIPNYQDKGIPFSAWLYRIARNLVANWHRDTNRRQMVGLEEIGSWQQSEGGPERLIQMVENEESLLKSIRRLPADRQELLILKFLHGLPNVEIGSIMGRSEGAIKSLYHRTLLALREDLGDEFIHERQQHKRKPRPRVNWRFWNRGQDAEASAENNQKRTDDLDS